MELDKVEDTEKEDDFVNKIEAMPKPVFVQKNNLKLKTNKYSKNLLIWMDTLKLPYYSSGGVRISNHPLEKIPEEETLLHEHNDANVNRNESSILTNSHALNNQDSDKESESSMNGHLNFYNADSVEHPLLQKQAITEVKVINSDDQSNTCKYVNNLTTTTTNIATSIANTDTLPNEILTAGPHIYKKKHLKRAFDKPGEDKIILSLGKSN